MFREASIRAASTPTLGAAAFAVAVLMLASSVGLTQAVAQARGNVQAEQSRSLHDRLFGRNLPATGRYVSETGQSFVLDRSGARPLLRFDRSPEVWVLRAVPAPRGDIIYRNDSGQQVLRVTADGGVTLYLPAHPGGVPVSMTGPAPSLQLPAISPTQLASHMVRQSVIMSRAVGHLVVVEAEIESPDMPPVVAETISVATESILRMANSENLRDQAASIRRVLVVEGDRARISFAAGTLRIVIDSRQGVAGRPSSARIVHAFLSR